MNFKKSFFAASLIISLIFSGCRSKDRLDISNDFSISISFRHSFAKPMDLHIRQTNNHAVASVEIFDYRNAGHPISSEKTDLSNEEVKQFIKLLKNTPVFSLNSDSTMRGQHTDGGTTYFDAVQGNKKNKFEVEDWVTMDKGTRYDALIEAAFYVLNRKFPRFESYIEENQMYHPHGFPVKVRGQNPKIVRLYGRYFDEDSLQLANLLSQFDKTEPLILDLSNIQTIASIEQLLLDFDHTHSRVAWVIRPVLNDSADPEYSY